MRKALRSWAGICVIGAPANLFAAVTPGNLVLFRSSDVSTGNAAAILLDEYTTAGTLVQTLSVPSTGSSACTIDGSIGTEGILTLSQDGNLITFGGYRKDVGGSAPGTDAPATTNRVVATLSLSGAIDTSTAVTDLTGNYRAAATNDGSKMYVVGAGGIRYVTTPYASTTSVQIATRNSKAVVVADNILYTTHAVGSNVDHVQKYGTLPTSLTTYTAVVSSNLTDQPGGFELVDINSGVAGSDTLYVAGTDTGVNTIRKYTSNGTTWTASGVLNTGTHLPLDIFAVEGDGGAVNLYFTDSPVMGAPNFLYAFSDASGFGGTLSGTLGAAIATAPVGTGFRGVSGFLASGPTNAAWAVNADGNWSLATNWTPSAPNAAGAVANFGAVILAPRTVTVDAPEITGTINFDNANKYTIAGTTIGNTLTLDNSTAPVGINVVNGSHDINAPLVLAKDTVVTVTPAGSTLSLGSLQASSVGITKAGAGNLAVNNVRSGSLTVNTGKVSVIAGRSTAGTSNVKNLSVAGGATLDLNDQDLVYDYSGGTPLGTVQSLITSGYNGGLWNGVGINSTAAAVHNAVPGAHTVAVGYGEASTLGISGTFSGQTLTDATNVLVRYTYAGDANLDGTVDTIDFNLLASNFSGTNKVWGDGDANYDGTVDSVDFNLLASNFSQVLPAGGDFAGALVPEPTTGLIAGALGLLGMVRRRRSSC